MKKINIIKSLLFSALFVSACKMDLLPTDQIATDKFWHTESDAWYGLNACYSTLPGFNIMDDLYTDNAHSHKPWEGPFELLQMDGISAENDFGYDFSTIRIVNDFLQNVDQCNMDGTLKERVKAEARFFRALRYYYLTMRFGKVPVIRDVIPYETSQIPRDDVETVQNFILEELREIAEILPDEYDGTYFYEKGRIRRSAALALRARAALGFKKYDIAEEAAGKVISEGHHSLFRVKSLNEAQKKEAEEMKKFISLTGSDFDKFILGMFSYEALWFEQNASPDNPEYILTREYMADDKYCDELRYIYLRTSQLVTGYASYEPMQDLVDAYWNIDGRTFPNLPSVEVRKQNFEVFNQEFIDAETQKGYDQKKYIEKVSKMDLSTYDFIKEFCNRDSRFYASILFPGKGWHETDFGTFYYRWNPDDIIVNGNETWTGYAFRKMVALSPYNYYYSSADYPIIRYAEVLLTYAEARTQQKGWDESVRKALNDLRDRCGMPDVPESMPSKEAALEFIANERRIELAGEGHRYYDMRRYGEEYCKKVMSGPSYAPNGYVVVDKSWSDRLMLMPLPQTSIDLNPALKDDQNNGY